MSARIIVRVQKESFDASTEAAALTQIVIVQNWFEELKQKVPVGKK